MRNVLSLLVAGLVFGLAGCCYTCDVCDDCGDCSQMSYYGYGCNGCGEGMHMAPVESHEAVPSSSTEEVEVEVDAAH